MIDIAFVRTNSIIYDIRPIKILNSLYKKYELLILGWDRKGNYKFDFLKKELDWKPEEVKSQVKIFGLHAPFNKESLLSYAPMLIYFPLFWTWVLLCLIRSKPNIVYACDLDTILPCYLYKVLFRKKLIFDVFDRYAMTLIPYKFKRLHQIVNFFEEFFSSLASVLISV